MAQEADSMRDSKLAGSRASAYEEKKVSSNYSEIDIGFKGEEKRDKDRTRRSQRSSPPLMREDMLDDEKYKKDGTFGLVDKQ